MAPVLVSDNPILALDAVGPSTPTVDRAIEGLETGLLVLTGSTALRRGDLEGFELEMRLLSERLEHTQFTLTAPDTHLVLQVGATQPGLPAGDVPVRQAALAATRAGGIVVTNLLAADDPDHRMVAVAVPAFRFGETAPAFTLVGSLNHSRLADLARIPPLHPDGMVITIHDRNGVIIARSLHSDLHMGAPAGPGFQASVADRQSGILPGDDTPQGLPAIRAFSKAPVSGYTVVAALPLSSFEATIHRQLIETAVTGAAFLLLGLSAAAYLARCLVGKSQAVQSGGFSQTPSRLREVYEFAAHFLTAPARQEASQVLSQDSEAHLRDLVETLDLAAVMVHEMNGTIRFWSRGCAKMYGWTREQAVGKSSHEMLRTQFPVPLAEIEHTLLTIGIWKGELIQRRCDGTSIIIAAHKALKQDIAGNPHVVMEALVDVTALRDAEDALHTLNQGLEQRVQAEVTAREAAQQRAAHADQIQALGQLAGGIAHEFNNVLQAVAGGAALIARRPNDAEGVGQLVQVICNAAARGVLITQRMLVLACRSELKAEPVDAATLLDEMREVFIQTLGAAIDVEVQAEIGMPRLLADRAQLKTAIANLATNACDAGRWRFTTAGGI